MKPHPSSKSAFTLIEMLTVMAVIAILASMIVAVNGFAHKKAALTRADAEIRTISAASEAYKAEAGGYPRDATDSDLLDPRVEGNPTTSKYKKSSLVIYKALSGDENLDGKAKEKGYCEFRPDQLQKDATGKMAFIKDPFGNSYGYSTAGATAEEAYRQDVQKDASTKRPTGTALKGFNPTFDLWSTGGVVSSASSKIDDDIKRWVKNW